MVMDADEDIIDYIIYEDIGLFQYNIKIHPHGRLNYDCNTPSGSLIITLRACARSKAIVCCRYCRRHENCQISRFTRYLCALLACSQALQEEEKGPGSAHMHWGLHSDRLRYHSDRSRILHDV